MTHNTWWPVSNSSDKSHITSTLYLQHLFSFIQLNHWLTHPRSPTCLVGHSEISFKDTYKPPPAKLLSLFFYLLIQLQIPTLQHSSFWLTSTFYWSHSPTSDTSSLVVRYNHIYTMDNIEINETRGPQLCLNIHSGHQWSQKHPIYDHNIPNRYDPQMVPTFNYSWIIISMPRDTQGHI